jgi:hypothetical protein
MTQTDHATGRTATLPLLVAVVATAAALLWSYWTTLVRWLTAGPATRNSHGYLVPGSAWCCCGCGANTSLAGPWAWWLGVPLLAFGLGVRLVGAFYYFVWLDAISILPVVAGLFLLLAAGRPCAGLGRRCCSWPS